MLRAILSSVGLVVLGAVSVTALVIWDAVQDHVNIWDHVRDYWMGRMDG